MSDMPVSELRSYNPVDPGTRQIGPKSRTATLRQYLRDDIETAVHDGSAIVQGSVVKVEHKGSVTSQDHSMERATKFLSMLRATQGHPGDAGSAHSSAYRKALG